jgi:DNA invertase Pin-like site-specific DNA recombinase
MSHIYGYARVSTEHQDYEIQREQLEKAGAVKIFADKFTGSTAERPEFEKLQETLLDGDVVLITKLDRLGRNTKDLITIVEGWGKKGVGFKILDNSGIDTTTPTGKLIFTVFSAIAEFERTQILERTALGRKKAMDDGVQFGRPVEIDEKKIKAIKELAKTTSVAEACRQFNISRQSYYRLAK